MSKHEIEEFAKHLNKEIAVLELGSGISTISLARRCKSVHSFESEREWFGKMKYKLQKMKNVKYTFITADQPFANRSMATYEQFLTYLHELKDTLVNTEFDLIFIDGPARNECIKIIAQHARGNPHIFVHDFQHPDGRDYSLMMTYLHLVKLTETLAHFRLTNQEDG